MSNPLRTPDDYELFLYTLTEQFPVIIRSTVTFIRIGATLARVAGDLYFDYEFRLVVRERLVYDRLPVVMDWYGYEIWKGGEKLFWYDSQPHPDDSTLQNTHPYHKHIPPDVKHNRIPSSQMSFMRPNLPFLIEEIERLIEREKRRTTGGTNIQT